MYDPDVDVWMKTYGIKLKLPWWVRFLLAIPVFNLLLPRAKVEVHATVFTHRGEPCYGVSRTLNTYYVQDPVTKAVTIFLPLSIALTEHGYGTYLHVEVINKMLLWKLNVDNEGFSTGRLVIDKKQPISKHQWFDIDGNTTIPIQVKKKEDDNVEKAA